MATLAETFAATVVDEWARAQVRDAVVSPGSRSTPVALALGRDPRIDVHVVLDERDGGFFALGLARATGRPVVVCVTSGTAVAELHPAVAEAHHDAVPLLIVSADRPPELHDTGAPQTIEQSRLFEGLLRGMVDPGPPEGLPSTSWRSLAARAFLAAVGDGTGEPGPVQVNLAFREPLADGEPPGVDDLPRPRPAGAPWHRVLETAPVVASLPAEVTDLFAPGRRGLLVAGAGAGSPDLVLRAAAALGWPVLADGRSGLRSVEPLRGATVVAMADGILRSREVATELRPEVVVRVGAPWASKVLQGWLDGLGCPQVGLWPPGRWWDPARVVGAVLRLPPDLLWQEIAARAEPDRRAPGWAVAWQRVEDAARSAVADAFADGSAPVSGPGVAWTLGMGLPGDSVLVTSSSMPVRDVEWYAPRFASAPGPVSVLANRGANGIDGVLATAAGVAAGARGRPVVALVGDVAFLHDVGSLGNRPRVGSEPVPVEPVVVVVDNGGGAIFDSLPQATRVEAGLWRRLFLTPPSVDPAEVAAGFGREVEEATTLRELAAALAHSVPRADGTVVVARSSLAVDTEVHRYLSEAVSKAARRAVARS
jgi:2-succinyl-5-enolpyruvyl-6-hydroxy-3-cyclohexene-1-carboxylate synthase